MTKQPAEIEHLHARMIVFVGCTIAVTFAITVIGFVYGLLFVTGTLSGLVAANGLKRKPIDPTSGTPAP
jgi:ABC-type amino acid transport system permease subunit